MDETKLLNYLKGESDAEECLEVEAWYHASAEHKKQLDQLYYMLFVGERKVAMDGVDTENSLSVLKDRIKQKESEKKSVYRIRVSKWKRYAMPLAAFLCGLLVSVGAFTGFPPESRQDIFLLPNQGSGHRQFYRMERKYG